MSIFDMFKTDNSSSTASTAGSAQAATAQQLPPNVDAGITTPATAPATPPAPLDDFKNLWQNDPNATVTQPGINFNITPEQLTAISGQLDYSAMLTPELQQRIAAGGEDAIKANTELMQSIARANFEHNTLASTKLVEAALAKFTDQLDTTLASKM